MSSNPLGLPAPPGGNQTKAPSLLVSTIFTTLLALIVVIMRMYARIAVISNVGWDDYTIVIPMASGLLILFFWASSR